MMARKPSQKALRGARQRVRLQDQAVILQAEKRWLALRALCLQVARRTSATDLQSLCYKMASEAKIKFEADCLAASTIIHTPTPRRCPFHSYDLYNARRRLHGVVPTARRAVQDAVMYEKEIVVTGHTLDGERHTVLIVNMHGEVTFVHPQFKVGLSESGGVA